MIGVMLHHARAGDLQALFFRERMAFAAQHPTPVVAFASLEIVDATCGPTGRCRARDVAWSIRGGEMVGRVYLLRRALRDLSWDNLVGVLRHELGHLADPSPSAPGAEARADEVAAKATGSPMRYDEGGVQTIRQDASPVRPPWLHG